MNCLYKHKDAKTTAGIDFTSICPKKREGKQCPYCYVETARKNGFRAKKEIDYMAYNGELLKLKQTMIDKLNNMGGLRMFSFSDYMPEHDKDIIACLKDAEKIGLKIKVITKQLNFVEKFHDYTAISVINLSVDSLNCGINYEVALLYREKYNKVKIRCIILSDNDIKLFSESDVFTFNHGNNGFFNYTNRHNKAKKLQLILDNSLTGKTCCDTGKCETCDLKCGY